MQIENWWRDIDTQIINIITQAKHLMDIYIKIYVLQLQD